MNMKNKRGFTLIELLAVIVILAIIMVIATMQVNKTIKKARQDSFALAFKSLKKQIQQRIATGEEYLCYDSVRGNKKIENINMNDFFGNHYSGICGNGKNGVLGGLKEAIIKKEDYLEDYAKNATTGKVEFYVTGPLTDYGVSACQDIYDISDDYRMWVSYQAANGHVSLLLNATDGKFNGVKYIQEMVEDIGATSSAKTTSTLEKEIKIKYVADSDNPRLTYKLIKRPGNDECKYDPSVEHFVNTEIDNNKLSYQCFYQWDYPDKVIKNLNNAANAAEDGYITIKQACDIFTNPDNWDSDKKKR